MDLRQGVWFVFRTGDGNAEDATLDAGCGVDAMGWMGTSAGYLFYVEEKKRNP